MTSTARMGFSSLPSPCSPWWWSPPSGTPWCGGCGWCGARAVLGGVTVVAAERKGVAEGHAAASCSVLMALHDGQRATLFGSVRVLRQAFPDRRAQLLTG